MAILKPEDLDKVKRRQIQNILAKQASGKTITAREERALAEAATETPTCSANFVRTYDELARHLCVSRKTLQNVCKKHLNEFPVARPDGRHDVTAWLNFFVDKNINRTAEHIADDDLPISVTDWKAEELRLKCEKLTLENARVASELVLAADVESGLSQLVAAFRQALNNFAPRLAQKILNVSDYHEAEQLITEETNVVLRVLQNADFLPQIQPLSAAATSAIEENLPPGKSSFSPEMDAVKPPSSLGRIDDSRTKQARPSKKTTSPGSGKRKTSRSRAECASSEVKRK